MSRNIVFLPGDGIGPEVTEAAQAVLEWANKTHDLGLLLSAHDFGGAAIDKGHAPLPEATKEACLNATAVFLGAVGGPKWDDHSVRPEMGLLDLRKALNVFANLRPTKMASALADLSPLRTVDASTDFIIVRELTGGIYFGNKTEGGDTAIDECAYSRHEIERIAHVAFKTARKRGKHVTSVDKANVLATSRLWRNTVIELQRTDYPDISLDHMLVDAMAMKLIQAPSSFDVILTENMFGDILSDEASVLSGSIGLAPSSSVGEGHGGLYEPIHGSAPDIAGQDIANPIGAILSVAQLCRHALSADDAAKNIEDAVEKTLSDGHRTRDLGGQIGCRAMTTAILNHLT